ncbi:MAG: SHOCT domain-containing protein [Fusobacterium sp.]|nr:SHOCT domain-containing protein [Fusobacterium sp.]
MSWFSLQGIFMILIISIPIFLILYVIFRIIKKINIFFTKKCFICGINGGWYKISGGFICKKCIRLCEIKYRNKKKCRPLSREEIRISIEKEKERVEKVRERIRMLNQEKHEEEEKVKKIKEEKIRRKKEEKEQKKKDKKVREEKIKEEKQKVREEKIRIKKEKEKKIKAEKEKKIKEEEEKRKEEEKIKKKKEEEIKKFKITKVVEGFDKKILVAFDNESKKIMIYKYISRKEIEKYIYSYYDIVKCSFREGPVEVKNNNNTGDILLGAAAFGTKGAVLGSMMGSNVQKKTITNMYVRIVLKISGELKYDFINIINFKTTVGSSSYNIGKNTGEKIIDILEDIIKEQKKESKQINSSLSIPDEILKYKTLLEQRIITQEEFDKKKKELLNL